MLVLIGLLLFKLPSGDKDEIIELHDEVDRERTAKIKATAEALKERIKNEHAKVNAGYDNLSGRVSAIIARARARTKKNNDSQNR